MITAKGFFRKCILTIYKLNDTIAYIKLYKLVGFLRALQFPPTGKVDWVGIVYCVPRVLCKRETFSVKLDQPGSLFKQQGIKLLRRA